LCKLKWGGERRGGCLCIFVRCLGAKSSFHLSFFPGDYGEEGGGGLPFVAEYRARRLWPSSSLGYGEKGRVGPSHHPLPCPLLSFPFSPSQTLATVGLACKPTPSGAERRAARRPDNELAWCRDGATHSHAFSSLLLLLLTSSNPSRRPAAVGLSSLGSRVGTRRPCLLLPNHEHGLRSDQVCVPCRRRLWRPWRTGIARGGRAIAVGGEARTTTAARDAGRPAGMPSRPLHPTYFLSLSLSLPSQPPLSQQTAATRVGAREQDLCWCGPQVHGGGFVSSASSIHGHTAAPIERRSSLPWHRPQLTHSCYFTLCSSCSNTSPRYGASFC
jgi:hypothetical protein